MPTPFSRSGRSRSAPAPYCSAYKTVAPYIQPVKVYDLGLDDDLDLIRYAKTHGLGYLQPEPEIEVTFQPGNSREEFDRNCPGCRVARPVHRSRGPVVVRLEVLPPGRDDL